jgi:hypothetical protein
MTPEQRRKKVYDLTYAHLLRPDPVNWLVAADLLEEDGQEELATRWRRRASLLEPLRAAFVAMKVHQSRDAYSLEWRKREVVIPAGKLTATFTYASRSCTSVLICLLAPDGVPLRSTYLGTFWGVNNRYVTQKLIEVIDWCTQYELHPPPPVQ